MMSCLPKLREKIFLIGDVEVQICGNKLPSNSQVLKVLFFNLRHLKLSLDEAALLVIKEVCVFWEKARIPTRAPHHYVKKLKTLHQEWRNLQKSASKPYNIEKEENFSSMLKTLFDIAHQDAMNDIGEQAREFLSNQRKDERIGYIADIETAYDVEENVRLQKEAIEKERLQKQKMREENTDEQVQLESGSSQATSSQLLTGSEFNPEECGGSSQSKKRRGTTMIMTEKLAVVLDKCKVTNRNAVHLIISTAQALNCDVSSLVINTTSIRCSRNEFREERAKRIKKMFKGTELNSIVLHWDGKLLPNFQKHDTTERLPVIISNEKTEQLLGIPELENSKGSTQAKAIYELLVDWDLCEKVKGLCRGVYYSQNDCPKYYTIAHVFHALHRYCTGITCIA